MEQKKEVIDLEEVVRVGWVRRWLVCGPFPAGDPDHLYRLFQMGRLEMPEVDPLGGELFFEPHQGMVHSSDQIPEKRTTWTIVSAESEWLDLSKVVPHAEHGIIYAATYLHSNADRVIVCDFVPFALGRLIHNHSIISPESGPLVLRMRRGTNLLLFKILGSRRRGGPWAMSCSFRALERVGSSQLYVSAPRVTGFFRGSAERPEAEIEFEVANTGTGDLKDIKFSSSLEGFNAKSAGGVQILPLNRALKVRHGVPMPKSGVQHESFVLEVKYGGFTKRLEEGLVGLRPPSGGKIVLGAGFHCDPVWTNTQSMYNDISLNNVTQYLNVCRADEDYKVILHELDYLKPYYDFYLSDREYMAQLRKEQRIILGGSYNQPNEKNVSGEQLIRNILYGKMFARSQFGLDPKVYHSWDVFGHVSQLSQILSKSGFLGAIWSKPVKGFPPIFRHMSPDGSTLLHRRVAYGFTTRSMDELRQRAYTRFKEMQSLGHSVDLRMDCTDFKSPTAWILGKCGELKRLLPRIEVGNPQDFFEDIINEEEAGLVLPTTSRDPSQYHIGTSLSRVELKVANRLGEALLYNAEVLSTISSLLGLQYPDLYLDKAWRQLLFNSHHDGISGTSCDKSYLDMLQGYREALHLAGMAAQNALDFIASKIQDVEGRSGIMIFNTLNWARSDVARAVVTFESPVSGFVLRDQSGREVPYIVLEKRTSKQGSYETVIEFVARDVPSVGYLTYHIEPTDSYHGSESTTDSDATSVENEYYRITVDSSRGGGICSIVDKQTGKEFVDPSKGYLANEIVLMREKADRPEPSWELYTTGERIFSGEFPAKCEVVRSQVGSKMVIKSKIGEICELVREVRLYKGIKRIDLRTEIRGYSGKDDLFAALFPTQIEGAMPTYEERFGAIVRPRGRRQFDYRTWRADAYSDCMIHACQNFFDLGPTPRVTVRDPTGRIVSSLAFGSVGLVLPHFNRVIVLSRKIQMALARLGVLTTPFYDDDDLKRREELVFEDSTEPKDKRLDTSSTFRISVGTGGNNSYTNSILGSVPHSIAERFRAAVERDGYAILLTLEDASKGTETVPVILIEAKNDELLEEVIDDLAKELEKGEITVSADETTIKGGNMEERGLTVINRGNLASTVEPDGTMTLLLKHTSRWSRVHLDEEFVPEWKDHVFLYSLYPHDGSWRDAKSYKKGWEFNIPLLSTQISGSRSPGQSLPRSWSFVSIKGEGVVLSALKPAGNPLAESSGRRSRASDGIVMRLYEAEGRNSEISFRFAYPVMQVWRCNLLEEEISPVERSGNGFHAAIGPFSVETFKLNLSLSSREAEQPVNEVEAVQPIYTRYWKENLGAAPIGYQLVNVFIEGTPITEAGGRGTTVNRLKVCVVNDYADRSISGVAVIEAPNGWTVKPKLIKYNVPPRSYRKYDFALSFSGTRRIGLIRVRLEHDRQVLEDVMEIGEKSRLTYTGGGAVYQDVLKTQYERAISWSASRGPEGISVRVENPYSESIDGGVAIICPPEAWSPSEIGDYSLSEVTPAVQAFHIQPKSFQVLNFRVRQKARPARIWAYAKLFYMGRTDYKRIL